LRREQLRNAHDEAMLEEDKRQRRVAEQSAAAAAATASDAAAQAERLRQAAAEAEAQNKAHEQRAAEARAQDSAQAPSNRLRYQGNEVCGMLVTACCMAQAAAICISTHSWCHA
jgi:hypothetical protein